MGRPPKGTITDDGRECVRCGLFKPWSEYARNANPLATKTGYSSDCKECHRLAYQGDQKCLDCGKQISRSGIRCKPCSSSGPRNAMWRGGERTVNEEGYVRVYTFQYGRVLEHKAKMQDRLGRLLFPDENVHHKNGDRADNEDSNLELWSKAHPPGQRVEDKLAWCQSFLARYGYTVTPPEVASDPAA